MLINITVKMRVVLLVLFMVNQVDALRSCYKCGNVNFIWGHDSGNLIVKMVIYYIKNTQGTDHNCIKQGPAFLASNPSTVSCHTHCLFSKQTVSFITHGTNLTYEYHIRDCADQVNYDPKGGCNLGSPYYFNKGRKAMEANDNDPNTLKLSGTFCYCNNGNNCNTGITVPIITSGNSSTIRKIRRNFTNSYLSEVSSATSTLAESSVLAGVCTLTFLLQLYKTLGEVYI